LPCSSREAEEKISQHGLASDLRSYLLVLLADRLSKVHRSIAGTPSSLSRVKRKHLRVSTFVFNA
jgi:hypothetical protein